VAVALATALLGVGAARLRPVAGRVVRHVDPGESDARAGDRRADGVQEVSIQTQDDCVFTPNRFSAKRGTNRLTVTNVGTHISHSFRFTPGQGPEPIPQQILPLTAGQKQTIQFTVIRPRTDQFECTFHVDLGQMGTMTVGG
jgi:plastocyanin